AGTGVLNENSRCSCGHRAVCDRISDPVGDLVSSFAPCCNLKEFAVCLHNLAEGGHEARPQPSYSGVAQSCRELRMPECAHRAEASLGSSLTMERTAIYARCHPRLNPHGRGDQRERSQIQSVDLRLSEPLDPTDSVEALPSAAVLRSLISQYFGTFLFKRLKRVAINGIRESQHCYASF